MDRRRFLTAGTVLGSGLLGDVTLRAARRHLGLWSAPPEPRATPAVRDRALSARVDAVDDDTVTVSLTATESREPIRVVVYRRTYPDGRVRSRAASDRVRVDADATGTTVTVDVAQDALEPDHDPWFYEVYARPGPDAEPRAYLCESAPYAWTSPGSAVRAPRVADAASTVDGGAFERRHDGNDYVLTYRWRDVDDATWTVDYRVRRSTHEAAVAADRGYVRTYEASRENPIAAHLLARLDHSARRSDTPTGSDTATRTTDGGGVERPGTDGGLASLDPGQRFDALVRFVQAIEYGYDADTVGAYDYHRTVEETLVAGVGDCKDRTYLLAGLLHHAFDCRTALLFQSGHVLLGVHPDDVPALPYDHDAVTIGDDDWVAVEPSLHVPVGYHTSAPFLAVYADREWRYHDAGAIVRGADRVLGTLTDYVV
ncbi:hypothetical protein [Halorubellus salinus]|uniref:hypothetical protein n=1 Tax=Halorubellus salinus TaxID=755309 RepID=UPI001D074324|nr:hypothetical protein [Halorubellus salinus]